MVIPVLRLVAWFAVCTDDGTLLRVELGLQIAFVLEPGCEAFTLPVFQHIELAYAVIVIDEELKRESLRTGEAEICEGAVQRGVGTVVGHSLEFGLPRLGH